MALNNKQKYFCECYVANGYNARRAYLEVYANSNAESAKGNSSRLMKNPEVKAYIAELKKNYLRKST